MNSWLGAVAIGAPVLQMGMMGTIGYPLAKSRPGGMARFHRSGFTWWVVALGIVVAFGIATAPETLRPGAPAGHGVTALRVLATVPVALAAAVAVELAVEAWSRRGDGVAVRVARRRYEEILPGWARTAEGEAVLVSGLAVLEEAVYRGVGLGTAVGHWGLPEPAAVALVGVAFGLGHGYFGVRQAAVKSAVGVVLCMAALSAGWMAGAAVHVLLNLVLVGVARRASP